MSISTHGFTTIDRAFCRSPYKEKDKGGDQGEDGDAPNVLELEFMQIMSIEMVKDNEICVDRHSEGPKDICKWEPMRAAISTCAISLIHGIPDTYI